VIKVYCYKKISLINCIDKRWIIKEENKNYFANSNYLGRPKLVRKNMKKKRKCQRIKK